MGDVCMLDFSLPTVQRLFGGLKWKYACIMSGQGVGVCVMFTVF